MCLLITQDEKSPAISDEWLDDFFSYNSDGIGVMYSENNTLIIEKALPKSKDEFRHFYHSHIKGKTCAFHLRMRTHGEIDMENCHPYEVLNRKDHGFNLWLMHNGVLSTGNDKDKTKSDTWHYIRDFIRPMLESNPDFVFHPSFKEIVEKHIGESNKFVLMSDNGKTVIINEKSGVYWAGLWLSNTYAWSAPSSISETPIASLKTAKKQSKEKPSPKTYKLGSMSYYPSDSYFYDSWRQDDFIEKYLDEFLTLGLTDASELSFSEIDEFIRIYDANAFYDLADTLLNGEIDQKLFTDTIRNPESALESFPYLMSYETTY
jgi:predicted glutamine amidotransferase